MAVAISQQRLASVGFGVLLAAGGSLWSARSLVAQPLAVDASLVPLTSREGQLLLHDGRARALTSPVSPGG